ncbi:MULTISPECIES: electron transport complex subunit RsxE [Clostridium]|uniref:Ion-translocating oxidoreductase complex subunit E n=1 Tax=Clostridium senegalense TaxID=1465809 RepID=A0A6M0H735_9CLOT|nr:MULTISPECIES: electron transport complex subunit E [Clostridium]MBU5227571.1 electron transport complex subunit E [Clostridium senegalense]NEU06168.1 electron transport complex subunit E [Clostridium senegalense]
MSKLTERLKAGIIVENPVFIQVLAMCPTLATTSNVKNAIGMGLAATAVLIGSNAVIALLRKCIPDKIRIPAFIVIIASFVTLIQFLVQGYLPDLYKELGLFIPLIVVNCIILGRAEAYASKNTVIDSIFDAIGMGLGFTLALTVLASVREILGAGTFYGLQVLPKAYEPAGIMLLAPGAFITLGVLLAILNQYKISSAKKSKLSK